METFPKMFLADIQYRCKGIIMAAGGARQPSVLQFFKKATELTEDEKTRFAEAEKVVLLCLTMTYIIPEGRGGTCGV